MGKKPTIPFGHIAFGKDGSVKPNIQTLSDDKAEQEIAVGNALAHFANEIFEAETTVVPTAEADHDFQFFIGGNARATVQCTEVVYRDFLAKDGVASNEHVLLDDKLRAIDIARRDAILVERIRLKIDKNYSKPNQTEFWLVIWSLTFQTLGDFVSGGKDQSSTAISNARAFVSSMGAGPFDRIFFFNMQTRPSIIWPIP